MKDSKEKEHRISNLKDMIDNINSEEENEELEEDVELIDYLNEDLTNYDDLKINDEFIYHPGDEKNYAINLEENHIDEEFLINTPKTDDREEENEEADDFGEDLLGDVSDSFDNIINAKIGKTPILAIISTILGMIFIICGAFIFNSRADRVIDNVVSGENSFITICFIAIGLLMIIYGLYRIIGLKNPFSNIMEEMDSIERGDNKDDDEKETEKPAEKTIPNSKIPLDKESYKIGEFHMGEIKNKLKRTKSKPTVKSVEENNEDLPPAREKPAEKKGLTEEEIEQMEFEKAKLDNESIDEIFAEVDDIDDLDTKPIDSKK